MKRHYWDDLTWFDRAVLWLFCLVWRSRLRDHHRYRRLLVEGLTCEAHEQRQLLRDISRARPTPPRKSGRWGYSETP